jgi:hypothetical protein
LSAEHAATAAQEETRVMQSVSAIERRTMAKVYLRLLPFCFVLYFICYLDRVNIGFAALTMNKDIGLSSYVFGLGAGAFFWVISFSRCRAISSSKRSVRAAGSAAS